MSSLFNSLQPSRPSERELKYKCPDCIDEEVTHPVVDKIGGGFLSKLCSICGATLEVISDASVASELFSEEELMAQLLDSLGFDMRDMLEEYMLEASSAYKISADFLKRLGSLTVDERSAVLLDCHLQIGPLKMMGICSSFGNIPNSLPHTLTRPVYVGKPKHGEDSLVSVSGSGSKNIALLADSIVVLHRGVVSFAAKTMRALEAGASALVVIQNSDKWPFQMADSARELSHLHQGVSPIPVVMISQRDGTLLESFLKSSWVPAAGRGGGGGSGHDERCVNRQLTLTIGARSVECCICQESMMREGGGEEGKTAVTVTAAASAAAVQSEDPQPQGVVVPVVLKLPCRHVFHTECIHSWFENHSTCPMCRQDVTKSTGAGTASGSGRGGNGDVAAAAAAAGEGRDEYGEQSEDPSVVRRRSRPVRDNGGQPYFV